MGRRAQRRRRDVEQLGAFELALQDAIASDLAICGDCGGPRVPPVDAPPMPELPTDGFADGVVMPGYCPRCSTWFALVVDSDRRWIRALGTL
jgi:hypothetical protein